MSFVLYLQFVLCSYYIARIMHWRSFVSTDTRDGKFISFEVGSLASDSPHVRSPGQFGVNHSWVRLHAVFYHTVLLHENFVSGITSENC